MNIVREFTHKGCGGLVVAALLGFLVQARPAHAADFACAAGDVACLISAINAANATGEADSITLAAGTYTLTAVDHMTEDGANDYRRFLEC